MLLCTYRVHRKASCVCLPLWILCWRAKVWANARWLKCQVPSTRYHFMSHAIEQDHDFFNKLRFRYSTKNYENHKYLEQEQQEVGTLFNYIYLLSNQKIWSFRGFLVFCVSEPWRLWPGHDPSEETLQLLRSAWWFGWDPDGSEDPSEQKKILKKKHVSLYDDPTEKICSQIENRKKKKRARFVVFFFGLWNVVMVDMLGMLPTSGKCPKTKQGHSQRGSLLHSF